MRYETRLLMLGLLCLSAAALAACVRAPATAHHAPATDGASSDGALGDGAPRDGAPPRDGLASGCPGALKPAGTYVTWCGKVNLHRDWTSTAWTTDPDCVSGCNLAPLTYCRKFWPEVTLHVEVAVSPEDKPWQNRGCAPTTALPGFEQFLCCAP